jgi:hypothetical protein
MVVLDTVKEEADVAVAAPVTDIVPVVAPGITIKLSDPAD